jgi:competence protein ComEC
MVGQFLKVSKSRAVAVSPPASRIATFERSHLEVRMFNVGDGEAVVVTFPGKRSWIIDAGSSKNARRNEKLGDCLASYFSDEALILQGVVPSHPHIDHAGAFATVLKSRPRFGSKLWYCRSEDATWHKKDGWIPALDRTLRGLSVPVGQVVLANARREVPAGNEARARLFAGSGEADYTSIFVLFEFRRARILFTGDAHCSYESELLDMFKRDIDFRADVLKVTHHGSSSGTGRRLVRAVKPGIAIASTAGDTGHLLERDTLERLGSRPGRRGPRAIFETVIDGDIILQTDGRHFADGVLYRVDFESPGRFEQELHLEVLNPKDVDKKRTRKNDPDCR